MNFDTGPIDIDAISKRNAETVVTFLEMSLVREPDQQPDPEKASAFMKNVLEGLSDTARLAGEVKRMRDQRQKVRDIHSPANSSDPAAPGAICTGCSLHGARVMWPCPTWNATEDPRTPAAGGLL